MLQTVILEITFILSGIIAITAGVYSLTDKNNKSRYGTSLFWIIFGLIFIFGSILPSYIVGLVILIMGLLSVFNQVQLTTIPDSTEEFKQEKSIELGNKLWIPALSIGILAIIFSQIKIIGGLAGLGISAIVAFLLALILTKESSSIGYFRDAPRLLHSVGSSIILPQLLGALGAVFSIVGVGSVVAEIMSDIFPIGSPLMGVTLYCVSMALFTIIMGNAFAAFAVITAGIGFPFVINIGGDPAVVGALGLTAGYCGTLITPMAANFNIVPAAIMEIDDKYEIIKIQLPIALLLLITHILLMYFLAF